MADSPDDSQGGLRESYDRIAEEYARRIYGELEHKPLDRALLDYFAEEMRDRGVIADIGCGPGHVGRYLFDRGLPVEGIDLSPGMVRLATRLNPGMHFRQGSMLDLDVQDGAWAGIVAFYSIIHVPPEDLPPVFSEFYRAISSGGLVLVAFHAGTKHVHLDEWWEHDVSVDTYFFRTDQIERMLGDAGFAVWAHLERRPNEAVEHPSDRGYVIARKEL